MSTELQTTNGPNGVTVAQAAMSAGVARIVEWADSARAAYAVAESLVTTSFVPEAFRGKPHEATAAILCGGEVGLSPMASLRSFDIIQGTAAPRALTLRAIVQSFGHEVIIDDSTATRCKMLGRRRGSDKWQSSVWTIDRAKRLGLTGKKNWQSQPEAMLVARATGEICRLIAADAILGIGYTAEEIEDGTAEASVTPIRRAPVEPARTAQRAPVDEPPLDGPETPALVDVSDAVDMVTSAQLKKVGAAMSSLGLTDRADALAFVTSVVGREITTRNDLTKDEASRVIDRLEELEAADASSEPTLEEQARIVAAERAEAGQ